MSDSPGVPARRKTKPPAKAEPEQDRILEQFLIIEEKKIEVENLRVQNEAKELQISGETEKIAAELARKDASNDHERTIKRYGLFELISKRVFWIVIIIILTITGTVIFLGTRDATMFERFLGFLKDIAKLAIGAVLGYLFKTARPGRNRKP